MPSTQVVSVSSTARFEATGSDQQSVVVTNLGPDLCYYATASTVSSGSNDGSLASGAQLAFTPSKFFISAGTSRLQVVTTEQQRQYDRDLGLPGVIAPMHGGLMSWNPTVLTASRSYGGRFVVSRPMTIVNMKYIVTTAASTDDPVDVGIYNAAYGKLVSAGATAGKLNALGWQTVTVAATVLVPGVAYYANLSVGTIGGTVPQLLMTNTQNATVPDAFGTTAGLRIAGIKAADHPLPTTWAPSAGSANVPLMLLCES